MCLRNFNKRRMILSNTRNRAKRRRVTYDGERRFRRAHEEVAPVEIPEIFISLNPIQQAASEYWRRRFGGTDA